MRDKTRKSRSTGIRRRQIRQASQASAQARRYFCDIPECGEWFRHSTDRSRHLWTHLPERLRPTCPFEEPSGELCDVQYIGRADHIRGHWERDHGETPFPGPIKWPKLRHILKENGIRLGEDAPPDISTFGDPYSLPVPSSAHFHQAQPGPFGVHHHGPLHSDPYYATSPQGYNTQHAALVHQTITPLPPPSFIGGYPPPFPQYFHSPIHNHPNAYGQPHPYPPASAPSPEPVYTPAPSQYEQYPGDYFHPGYNNRSHSPIEGSDIHSFNGEGADQGSSTNPFAGRYDNNQNSSFKYNHYGF